MADPLSLPAGIVGIISLTLQVTQSLVTFYTAYRDQQSDVAHTARKLGTLLDVLELLQNELTNRKFRDDERDLLESIESLVNNCDEYAHELEAENDKFKKKSSEDVRSAARTVARRLAYPLRQSTLQKLDEDVDEIVSHLSLAMQVLHRKDAATTQNDIEDTKALLDLVRADQIASNIRTWLMAPDPTIEHNKACKKRHHDTGLWFVKGDAFASWLRTPNSFLWLNGFAGCGKSVLCSTTIQYALRHRRSSPRVAIAFFYFAFDDTSKQDVSAMLRALVLQLSAQRGDSHDILLRLHGSYSNARPSDQVLVDCLRQLVQTYDDVYIILDALDESPVAEHRPDVLQALADMRAWSEPGLHLLATSRDEPDIRDVLCGELGCSQDEEVPLKNDAVDGDIASFIRGSLKTDRRLRRWEKYHDEIERALTERARGVFRWVECQFTALKSCPHSKRHLDAVLASLPRSLDKTYERMLMNIGEESISDARRILMLLCCARRPLTVNELIEGVAVELGDNPRFDPEGRLDGEDDIRRVCPGLIEIDASPTSPRSTKPATVRIAHFSVQEYLESDRILQHRAAAFGIRTREAHTDIACICLTYLLEPALIASEDLETEYQLASYAARVWPQHFSDGDDKAPHVVAQVVRLFRGAGGEFDRWVRIWNADDYNGYAEVGKDIPSPVYYASILGQDVALSQLLCGGDSSGVSVPSLDWSVSVASDLVNARGGEYHTALQAASAGGYERVVRLLLEKGADPNTQGGTYGTSLQAASAGGYERVVRLLLEKGADPNAKGGAYGSSLQAASLKGSVEVVRELLDKDVNINVRAGYYGTALQAASKGGYERAVQMVLMNDADPNAKGGPYGASLQAASLKGSVEVVRELLDKGSNINALAGYYGAALQAALRKNHVKVARELLDKGADINALAGDYGTALQVASNKGHLEMVQLLLEMGADPNARGGMFGTPLQAASTRAFGQVVQLLLEKGADVNMGGDYSTVLQMASREGHVEVVRLLLERGGDVDRSGDHQAAVQAASAEGHEEIVRLLVEKGAVVEPDGWLDEGEPLRRRHGEIFKRGGRRKRH